MENLSNTINNNNIPNKNIFLSRNNTILFQNHKGYFFKSIIYKIINQGFAGHITLTNFIESGYRKFQTTTQLIKKSKRGF